MESNIKKYLELINERPELFLPSEDLEIITDLRVIEEYNKKEKIGVVYESDYLLIIKDLVKERNGNIFSYERTALPRKSGGVLAIIEYNSKLLCLKQYRHAIRKTVVGFVCGLNEDDINSFENVKKEIKEEINGEIEEIEYLGNVYSDVGVSNDNTDIFYVKISDYSLNKYHEAIADICLLDADEIKQMIRDGVIYDALTISAVSLFMCKKINMHNNC